MKEDLRQHIAEIYDGGCWEAVTGVCWEKGTPWQIHKFERIVDFDGGIYSCVILTKTVYDPFDISAVDYVKDLLFKAELID